MTSIFAASEHVRDNHLAQLGKVADSEIQLVKVSQNSNDSRPQCPNNARDVLQEKSNREPSRSKKSSGYSYGTMSRSSSTEEGPQVTNSKIKEARQKNKGSTEAQGSYTLKFKTEMCKNFQLQGYCRWANNCSYAHGMDELRQKTHLNTNFRSKICKLFHRQGGCPYGLR